MKVWHKLPNTEKLRKLKLLSYIDNVAIHYERNTVIILPNRMKNSSV